MARRATAFLLAGVLAACGTVDAAGPGGAAQPTAASSDNLRMFADCDELVAHMRSLALPYVTPNGFGQGIDSRFRGGGWTESVRPPEVGHGSGPRREDGVIRRLDIRAHFGPDRPDEPAHAKTDGRLLVRMDRGTLRITDVSGDTPRRRGALKLTERGQPVGSLLLAGDRVLVLGNASGPPDHTRLHETTLALVDVSDPARPKLLSTQVLTGWQVSARVAGSIAHLAITSDPFLVFRGSDGTAAGDAVARTHNREVVNSATVADWLPSRRASSPSGKPLGPAKPLVDCSEVRVPAEDSGLSTLSMFALDLTRDDLEPIDATALLAETDRVYNVGTRSYVTTFPGAWGRAPGDRIAPRRSAIHAFDLTTPTDTAYLGSGALDGYPPWALALSERDGVLRVLTRTGTPKYDGAEPWNSAVILMRPQNGVLAEIGRIESVGGEVDEFHWLDGRAASRTIRLGTPLRLVDVSKAAGTIRVAEFAIPGFRFRAGLLRAVGPTTIIGMGEGPYADNTVRFYAFDASNPADAKRMSLLDLGETSRSQGMPLYLDDRRTFVLPASVLVGRTRHHALLAVRVDEDGTLRRSGRLLLNGAINGLLPLGDGRLAVLHGDEVLIVDAENLRVRGRMR